MRKRIQRKEAGIGRHCKERRCKSKILAETPARTAAMATARRPRQTAFSSGNVA
jgi:hypothetical protein